MKIIVQGKVMPGGWHYKEKGVRRPYHSDSYIKLLDNELKYRLENKIIVGDVKADIDNYICANFKDQCHEVDNATRSKSGVVHMPERKDKGKRFIDHLLEWGTAAYQPDLKHVPKSIAETRGESCYRCPHNLEWENMCPTCVSKAQTLFALIRRGFDISKWRKLGACELHRFELRCAVWLENPKPNTLREPPGHCWLAKK